jgi:hypothetical protein
MTLRRVVLFGMALVLAGLGVWLCAAGDPAGYGAGVVRSAAVKGARQLERSHPAGTAVFEFNVQDAMNDVTRYGALTVAAKGTDAAGNDHFEITNEHGRHPVCLTVSGAAHPATGTGASTQQGSSPTGAGIRATVAGGPC